MKFDSNAAWKDACATIAANRELAAALAGVFFLIPSLAFALFLPQPESAPGLEQEQLIALMQAYYGRVWPWLLVMSVIQGVGTLAILALFTDRHRPTVAEAIRKGFTGIIPLIAAQLLLGLAFGVIGGVLMGLGAVTGLAAVIAVAVVALLVIVAYIFIKTSLVSPVIAVEDERNPVLAIRRSWQLTRGNSLRIGLFYVLFFLATVVIVSLLMALIGIVLTLVAGAETARLVSDILSSGAGAAAALYFAAILAAVHRQLAGPSQTALGATFE